MPLLLQHLSFLLNKLQVASRLNFSKAKHRGKLRFEAVYKCVIRIRCLHANASTDFATSSLFHALESAMVESVVDLTGTGAG